MRGFAFLLAFLVLATASSDLNFQYGNRLARLVNNRGYVAIDCVGGTGSYSYSFSDLPQGWTYQGNNLIIPGITDLRGAYSFRARVTDTAGNVLNGFINLKINGIAVVIQSGSGIFDNQITYQVSGNNGLGGLAGGLTGTTGTFSGITTSTTTSNTISGVSPSDLYAAYPGLPAGTNVVPPSGSFPTIPSPSGNPSTPNPTPNVIRTIQATYSPQRDAQPVSVDDVKRNAIFNRQLNANKAVANLIAIIQQLTANVNAARIDIQTLEQLLKDAELAYNNCNQEVFTLADTRARIENAVADRQNKLNDINGKINIILSQIGSQTKILDDLITKRTIAQQEASPNARKLADLQAQLAKCEAQRRKYESQLEDLKNQIAELRIKIQTTKDNAAAAPGEITRIDLQIPIVDRKILELQQQLIRTQREREDLLNEKDRFRKIISDASTLVRQYESEILTLERGIPRLESSIDDQNAICEGISKQLDDLRSIVGKNEANFQIILEEIRTQQAMISQKQDEINRLKDQIKGLPNEIAILTNELNRVEGSLRRQFYICNDAADEVRKAKQNVEAMSLKIETESRWLQEANLNLERARAQKELADVAVEEIISTSTSALPFSIVPNGNGLTNAGTPLGNNPSGSALGPVRIRNEVDPNRQIVIGDISSYLSRAYQAGVDPSRPSTVSSVFPLSVATLETLVAQSKTGLVNVDSSYQYPTGGIYGFGCSASDSMSYGQGTVYSVQPGMIQVRDNSGLLQNLRVGGCSNLEATQQGHSLGLNDQVYYRGVQANGGMNLYSLTCVA